jgi:G3E family GTPase
MYRLDSVITIVDSKHIMDRLAEVKHHGAENQAVEQIAFADKIILNKIDLCANEEELEEIEAKLKTINPTASIQRTQNAKVAPNEILNLQAFDLDRVLDFDPEFLKGNGHHEHHHDHTVTSVGVKVKGSVDIVMMDRWLERLAREDGADLYRYKGIIAVDDADMKFVFNGVGMLYSAGFVDKAWGADETRESRFVFIGKNLDHEMYVQGFAACQLDTPLRFAPGEMVEVNIGEYVKGKVLRQRDDGNAYRVEIQDSSFTNVYAPVDIDQYIRAYRGQKKDNKRKQATV